MTSQTRTCSDSGLARARRTVDLAHRLIAHLCTLNVPEQLAARVGVDLADLQEALAGVQRCTKALLEAGRTPDEYGDVLAELESHAIHAGYHLWHLRRALPRVAEIVDPDEEEDD